MPLLKRSDLLVSVVSEWRTQESSAVLLILPFHPIPHAILGFLCSGWALEFV